MDLVGSSGARRSISIAALTIAIAAAACSGAPTQPTAASPPPAAQRVDNTPPVIRSISVSLPRVEAGEDVSIAADVNDAETPVDQLGYQWSAAPAPGVFTGTGRRVTWKAPIGQPTPDVYTITLTLVETYVVDGVVQYNRTSSSAQIHYNESHQESANLGLAFLRDLANDNMTPTQVVRNFSDACPGKAQEMGVVQKERQDYRMLGGDFSIALTGLYEDRTVGEIVAPCTFRRVAKATGRSENAAGTCRMSMVYESWKWLLCDSTFSSSSGATALSKH